MEFLVDWVFEGRAKACRHWAGTPGRLSKSLSRFAKPFTVVTGRCQAFSACAPNSEPGSIFTPGPMVEDTATRLMKVPLAPGGFAF